MPETLGSGYLSLSRLLTGELVVYSLLLLIFVKTVLTALTIGLGIPGGMIGPTFIIGGLTGGYVALMFDSTVIDIAWFALIGMAAMMAACFQAPLTALVAIIEMTHSSQVIVPALFVIVLACLFMRVFFHQESVFVERLRFMGVSSNISAFQRYLRHHTIKPVAEEVVLLPMIVPIERVKDLASSMVDYVVFKNEDEWRLVRRIAVLDVVQTLDMGPQKWLVVSNDKVSMSLDKALISSDITVIEEPSSLETVLSWFQKTGQSDVLVSLPGSSFCLVSRHRLDQFLLENDEE